MAPTPSSAKESGICPYPLPMARAVFDSIVQLQREAIHKLYTEQREALMDDKFGSSRAERAGQSSQQTEADIAHLTRFHPKFGHPDPFAAPWLPPQCSVTVPRFPHHEMTLARNGVAALEPAEGRHLRQFVESGQRLLAIPYKELLTVPFMDSWLFKYALTRFFDYEDGAKRFLSFREAALDYGLPFSLTDEVRKYTIGAANPLPQYVDAVVKGTLLAEPTDLPDTPLLSKPKGKEPLLPAAVVPTSQAADSANSDESQCPKSNSAGRWSPRIPVVLIRSRLVRWDEVPTEAYCRADFYHSMIQLSLDWLAQVQGIIVQNSVKKVGFSSINLQFHRFNSRVTQKALPVKVARIFSVNEGFFIHNVAMPMMKLFAPAKILARICFVGKEYSILTTELGADRAMEECGGTLKMPSDGSMALALFDALRWEGEGPVLHPFGTKQQLDVKP